MKTQQKEMQTATLELGSSMCNCLWVVSAFKRVCIEQTKVDTASAHEVLANASSGIDNMHKELKSLVGKAVKSKVRDISRPDLWAKYLQLVQQIKHSRVECGLQEEHAALTRFNTKLCKLKRGRKGEEASKFQRGWHDQEARA